MDEVVHEFLVESHENLDQLDRDLLSLEEDPGSRPLLASVFRTIHTIKGTSGFLAFGKLEKLTHVGEGLLSLLRDGEMDLTPEITSLLLEMVDAVRALLGEIERTGAEGDVDHRHLILRLNAVQSLAGALKAAGSASAAPAAAAPVAAAGATPPVQPAAAAASSAAPAPSGRSEAPRLGEKLVADGVVTPDDVTLAVLEQTVGDPRPIGEILVDHGAVDPHTVSEALDASPDARRSVAESSIRVDVDVLDNLMRLVGELVLTRNQIASSIGDTADVTLHRNFQRLNLIAAELQDGVVKTRMQAIDTVWSKLPRVVRDLAKQMGKKAHLELVGADTELDRSVLEAVKDPLTHIVRNAMDHGLETPDVRLASGKSAEGRLVLRAFHESGNVYLEASDDGAGIDPRRLGEAAVRKGLLTADQVAGMTDRELLNCIFLPGFSTASQVTNVSGRGVGMDVVKTNMERIGGSVEVISEVGVGTTFRVKIPLTLAIVPALVAISGGRRYALPQSSVVELVRLDGKDRSERIETIAGAPVLRLRGTLLPLLFLDEVLGVAEERERSASAYVAVLGTEDRQFGLVLDDVLDTEEVVVKPLSKQLASIGLYAGATILGDGRVGLILDVWGLAEQQRVSMTSRVIDDDDIDGIDDDASMLVVRLSADRLLAIPLDRVSRLEDVDVSRIERVGQRDALQYRGGILPIVRLAELVDGTQTDVTQRAQVVVYTENDRSVGLVVEEALDIATDDLSSAADIDGPAIAGQTVVQQQVMDVLDVKAAILAADPHFYDETTGASA